MSILAQIIGSRVSNTGSRSDSIDIDLMPYTKLTLADFFNSIARRREFIL